MEKYGTESDLGIEGLVEEGEAFRRFIAVPPVPCVEVVSWLTLQMAMVENALPEKTLPESAKAPREAE